MQGITEIGAQRAMEKYKKPLHELTTHIDGGKGTYVDRRTHSFMRA
jgi:hypothetical protein